MGVADEILADREDGSVRCGSSSRDCPSLPELAAEFGLAPGPGLYTEIDADAARRIAESVLHRDLAYRCEIMPRARAAELAGRFLDQFGTDGVRFYTNATFREGRGPGGTWSAVSGHRATGATLDTGVLVVGPKCSGCLWVEDED